MFLKTPQEKLGINANKLTFQTMNPLFFKVPLVTGDFVGAKHFLPLTLGGNKGLMTNSPPKKQERCQLISA
jgi:hypothetical protein